MHTHTHAHTHIHTNIHSHIHPCAHTHAHVLVDWPRACPPRARTLPFRSKMQSFTETELKSTTYDKVSIWLQMRRVSTRYGKQRNRMHVHRFRQMQKKYPESRICHFLDTAPVQNDSRSPWGTEGLPSSHTACLAIIFNTATFFDGQHQLCILSFSVLNMYSSTL